MGLSEKTKREIGREDLPVREDLSNALGCQTTVIKAAEFSKAEEELLQTNALTVEDNDPFFTLYEVTQRNALIKPTYDPLLLVTLTHQNNTLLQCVSAMEVNIDGTGYTIEAKNPVDPEETLEGEVDGEEPEAVKGKKLPFGDKKPELDENGEEKKEPKTDKDGVEVPDDEDEEGKKKRLGDKFKEPPKDEAGIVEAEKDKFVDREAEKEQQEADDEKKKEIQDAEDEEKQNIMDFFDEPWPGMSFTTIRRKLRRDMETYGNAYIEVIRNVKGDIVFLNYLDAKLVRMVRLGMPTTVEEEVTRFGKTTKVMTLKRERRFAMLVGGKTTISNVTKVMYFKEFGASRSLNKWNGLWEGNNEDTPPSVKGGTSTSRMEGEPQPVKNDPEVPALTTVGEVGQDVEVGGAVDAASRATEIIHMTKLADITTLYGVPSWINNIPSVLGSRKAEELNLEFFNSGGLPPAMILIQGGSLSAQSRKALTGYMAGEAKHKQRGIIAEIFSTSGDLTSAGNVKVSVERFGAERQQDAMFMKYDEACAKHVRMAFRLPPLFLGDSKEHNFATAKASYMVAEAQVFDQERKEFDEIVNTKVMKEIAPEWIYRSMPLSVNDVEAQLEALKLADGKIDAECFVEQLAEVANLELECAQDDPEEEPDVGMEVATRMGMLEGAPAAVQNGEAGTQPFNQIDVKGDKFGKIAKIDDGILEELAQDWSDWLIGNKEFSDTSVEAMSMMIDALSPSVRKMFTSYVAMRMSPGDMHDHDGTAELLGCAAHDMADRVLGKDDLNTGDLAVTGGLLNPEQAQEFVKKPNEGEEDE